MKALISVIHPNERHRTDDLFVENVSGDDHLWEIVDKLQRSYPLSAVRIVWAGLSPREYTAAEVLKAERILG